MYTIAKTFHFSASHILHGLPQGHPCGRMHGHNYTVEVILAAPTVNSVGMVVDYGELAALREWIDLTLDHRHLNDAIAFFGRGWEDRQTTAETLARAFVDKIVREWPEWPLAAVRVSETPKTWASYSLDGGFC